MGSYNGIASQLRVKKDAPKELFDMLDYIYQLPGSENYQLNTGHPETSVVEKSFNEVSNMLTSGSPGGYMETWCWRCKEEKEDHWLYESYSSHKHVFKDAMLGFLHGIAPFLILKEGDIVFRYIYEESSVEKVYYFSRDTFHPDAGYQYASDQGYVTDDEHPYREKLGKDEEEMFSSDPDTRTRRLVGHTELYWTMPEIEKVLQKRQRDREKAIARHRGQGGYGFS